MGAGFWFKQCYWVWVFLIEMRGEKKTKREIGLKDMLTLTEL